MAGDDGIRKLAAILAADVAGYTRLMADDESATIATITDYRARFRNHIAANGGRVVDMAGDSVLAVFTSAAGAVRAAVATQADLADRNEALPEARRMRFRVGVNLGDIHEQDDGTVYGDGVNVAARLEGLAEPGGVMLSEDAHRQVRRDPDLTFADAGAHNVKNVDEPVRAYRLVRDGAPSAKVPRSWLAAAVIAVVVVAVAGVAAWQYMQPPEIETADVGRMAFPLPDEPSIAVLPFDNLSADDTHDYIADALVENIIAALSQAPGMMVIARNSTFTYKGRAVKVQQVAEDLGVRHVLEGSVQVAGDRIRVTAQLIDAITGRHMWSDRYDRPLGDVFALQDEISLNIVSALQVELTAGPGALAWRGGTRDLKAWALQQKGVVALRKFTKEDNLTARRLFEQAVAADPEFALAWAYLSDTYLWAARFSSDDAEFDENIERAETLAGKALSIDAELPMGHIQSAFLAWLRRDFDTALAFADEAVRLGPNRSLTLAQTGVLLIHAGRMDAGIDRMKLAMRLSPHYPAWYAHFLAKAYILGDRYEEAVAPAEETARRLRLNPWGLAALVQAHAGLGRIEDAKAARDELLTIIPSYSIDRIRQEDRRFFPLRPELLEKQVSLLRAAGVPEHTPGATAEKPVIAVLPFDNMSGDPGQRYFADGVSEQIIADLARFRELVVIARNSSFRFRGGDQDLREVGRTLGARYLVEGSLRKAGATIRVTAQLIDTENGAHLWTDTFERELTAANLFAIQDQITEGVVGAIAGAHGIIARVAQRPEAGIRTEDLAAYDCVLRAHTLRTHYEPAGHAGVRGCLERAVETNPDYAEAWSLLSLMYVVEHILGWNTRPDSLDRGLAAAARAVALDPNNENTHLALARPYFFMGDLDNFFAAAEKAVSINPLNADAVGTGGYFIAFAGRWERGLALLEQAMRLSPVYPAWWHGAAFWSHYRKGEYEAALVEAKKGITGDIWTGYVNMVLATAQLDDLVGTREAMTRLLALKPDFREMVRADLRSFYPLAVNFSPALMVRVVEGLRKAGVEVAEETD